MATQRRSNLLSAILACAVTLVSTLAGTAMAVADADDNDVTWSADTYVIWPAKSNAPTQASVVSWSDWMVFDHAVFDTPGVRFVVNKMAASGIRQLWWRTFGGGWALYSSQVDGVTTGNYAGQGADYGKYDSLADAVEFGHDLGLKVFAWFTPLEEAHAWPDNARSHAVDAYREMWDVSATGAALEAPSFYYDAYREYKVALAKEMATRYEVDALVIDFERRGAPGRSDQWGYLPQVVESFKRETGLDAHALDASDERWRRYRARHVGRFMADVRAAIDELDRPVELVAMFPIDQPLSAHWDIATWARQGLLDRLVLVAHGSEGWGRPTNCAEQYANRYVELGLPRSLIIYTQRGGREMIQQRVEAAVQAGFDEIVWFETTYQHFQDTYDIPRRLAGPGRATLISPVLDMTHGGELAVLAAGDWSLRMAGHDKVIAQGQADKVYRIVLPAGARHGQLAFEVSLASDAQRAGIAVQGWVRQMDGSRRGIQTDSTWHAEPSAADVQTIARPGIPPFLGNQVYQIVDLTRENDE